MFIINLSPIVMRGILTLRVADKKLTINGEVFDFTNIPVGATLPREAIDSEYVVSDVENVDGTIHISILYPISSTETRESVCFPQPIHVTKNGKVVLPND